MHTLMAMNANADARMHDLFHTSGSKYRPVEKLATQNWPSLKPSTFEITQKTLSQIKKSFKIHKLVW